MTIHNYDEAVQLALFHYGVIDSLDSVLDVDAGLREVMLYSHQAAQLDDLGSILDIEAGLTAILPHVNGVIESHEQEQSRKFEQLLRCVSPQDRLALRRYTDVLTAYRFLTRALDHTVDLSQACDLVRQLTADLDRDRTLDVARTREQVLERDREVARALRIRLDLSHARAVDLMHALTHTLELAPHFDLARELVHAFDHIRDCDLARQLADALTRDLSQDLDHAQAFNLTSTRQLARCLGRDIDHARKAARTFITLSVDWVQSAISTVLGREVPLHEDSVSVFLDDFTTSDLRTSPLDGINLEGVRWSETGTQWPAEIDIISLKAHSDEIRPYSGLYVVRSGWTVRDLADLV
ncbi:hypothetical protein ACWEPN_27935 [Nonomuraea wenchangensis]